MDIWIWIRNITMLTQKRYRTRMNMFKREGKIKEEVKKYKKNTLMLMVKRKEKKRKNIYKDTRSEE